MSSGSVPKVMFTRLAFGVLSLMVKAGAHKAVAVILSKAIVRESGSWKHAQPPRVTLLALSPRRFRGDIDVLPSSGVVRVLELPERWQQHMISWFWPLGSISSLESSWDFFSDLGSELEGCRARYRRFLTKLVAELFDRLNIDGVVSAAVWYVQDLDWGIAAEANGRAYIVLQAENLATAPGHVKRLEHNARRIGKFQGSYIITHNEVSRGAFVRGGLIAPDRIVAAGALRMDGYLKKIERGIQRSGQRKRVVLFSFHRMAGLWGLSKVNWPKDPSVGLTCFFEQVHRVIARLATELPSVDFVIKPKWGGQWIDEIQKVLEKDGISLDSQPNLTVSEALEPHSLILDSDVVIGFGSTTLLEASIAGKPTIMPVFEEASREEYKDYLHFSDSLDMFLVPRSEDALRREIVRCLENPVIDETRYALSKAAFESHVSSASGGVLERYISRLEAIVVERRQLIIDNNISQRKTG